MKLSINGISKSYGKKCALACFNAEFEPGIYALLGPNGSGKSTLMNIIVGNLSADSGNITFECDGEAEDTLKMGAVFRKKLGFMPQYPGMYPNFTVGRFMWYMAALKNMGAELDRKERHEYISSEVSRLLTAVELDDADVYGRKIGALSGGMKQRLALAQAMLGDPSVIILDEPTAGLDPKQRISIRNYISKIAFDKIVIIATHVVSDIEYIARDVIMLKKGMIIDSGTPRELTSKIEGKVWQIDVHETEVEKVGREYRVTGISKDESDIARLRVISEMPPTCDSISVLPTLEDYYLYVFGDDIQR